MTDFPRKQSFVFNGLAKPKAVSLALFDQFYTSTTEQPKKVKWEAFK